MQEPCPVGRASQHLRPGWSATDRTVGIHPRSAGGGSDDARNAAGDREFRDPESVAAVSGPAGRDAQLETASSAIADGEIDVPSYPIGPLIGPTPVHDVAITFDGETCRVEGPTTTVEGEPVGLRFVNDAEAFASLILVAETEPYLLNVPADRGAEALRSAVLPGGTFIVSVSDSSTDAGAPCGPFLVESE